MRSHQPTDTPGIADREILLDGAPLSVRELGVADRDAFLRLHAELPFRDRWLRFLGGVRGYRPEDAERALDPAHAIVAGAFLGGELVGVGQVVADGLLPGVDGRAEVAVAVGHAVQSRGVGTLLLEAAARVSRARGVREWTAIVLPENIGMLTVLDDLGLPITRRHDPDVEEIIVDLTPVDDPGSRFAFAAYGREVRADRTSLRAILRPDCVAVIGASRRHGTVGRAVLESLQTGGFHGRLLAVNPHTSVLGGVRCHPTVAALPCMPDLAVVATPPAAVPGVAEECGRRGVPALLVLTAGLSAAEADGLRDAVRRHGMRLVGPNCLGVAGADLDATFARGRIPRGHVGLVAQSGGVAIALLEAFRSLGLGCSTLVSIGDRWDVSSNDLLRWWAEDNETRVAVVHVESLGNPRVFARVARRLAERIPVLAVRAASTEVGARAAASHTAAAATPAVHRDAVFDQAGVIAVDGLHELVVATAALSWSPPAAGDRVAVLSNAGGAGVLAADACVRRGLRVPPLSPGTCARLAALLPATAAVAGPVDTGATVTAETLAACLELLLEAPEVDVILAVTCPTALGDPAAGVRSALAGAAPATPVVHVDLGQAPAVSPLRPAPRSALAAQGLPAPVGVRVGDPVDGALALDVLARRARHLARPPGRRLDEPVDLGEVARVVSMFLAEHPDGGWLDPEGCFRLLRAGAVPAVQGAVVTDSTDAVGAARAVGGPVALKAVVHGVLHKSLAGAVRLGVTGDDAVRAAAEEFAATFGDRLRGMLVQPMAPSGTELLVGLTAGPEGMPLLALGVGGTGTDLADRRWHRLVPLDDVDVTELVGRLPWDKAAAGLDRAAVETVVARVACLAELVPQIEEMDLNPVVCSASDARAVDVRIRLVPRAG
jgi:acyl-CoA synthetase (NDP forming)/GNAT superfamily N-acetyltransferase